jgi:energy-coupling factor transporter ATP-binding protein EcfA2
MEFVQNMFTHLHVENFLSLKNVDVELGKVNVFIGPNASGKSNIAKVFRLIAKHVREGVPTLEGYDRLRDLSFSFNPVVNIYIALRAHIGRYVYGYALELTNEKYFERILADNELIIEHDGSSDITHVKGQRIRNLTHPLMSAYYGRMAYKSILSALPSNIEAEARYLVSSLGRISVHSFAPDVLRSKNPVKEQPFLKYHGENLARYLLYLYTERRRDFWRVEETLRNMIPEVEEIIPHIEETDVEIWIKIKGLEEPLKPHNISDGTLRILAIISALYGGFSLIVLEEPENCVHPYLLETLMDLARDSPSQVIITTHSPYLLDHVKPEEVYLVRKEGLETNVKKLSTTSEMEYAKRFLEEGGTLGEAWYSGVIGGTP